MSSQDTEKKLYLISDHPDKFGPLAQAFQSINSDKLIKKGKSLFNYILAFLLVLTIPIGYRIYIELSLPQAANGQVWIDSLKIIALYVCIASTIAMIAAGLYYFRIKYLLMQLESEAEVGRDMARVMFPYYRQELQELRHKIKGATQVSSTDAAGFATIVQGLLPVAQMLLKKDANLINWGMQGFKLYKTVTGMFKK